MRISRVDGASLLSSTRVHARQVLLVLEERLLSVIIAELVIREVSDVHWVVALVAAIRLLGHVGVVAKVIVGAIILMLLRVRSGLPWLRIVQLDVSSRFGRRHVRPIVTIRAAVVARHPLFSVGIELAVAVELLTHGTLAWQVGVGVARIAERRQRELHGRALEVGLRHASRLVGR